MSEEIVVKKQGDIEIRVTMEKCIGASTCVVYAEDTFDLDDEDLVLIKEGQWDKFEKIVEAARSCPTTAIEVFKAGERIYPEDDD